MRTVQQILGFALVGCLFFLWFAGHVKNEGSPQPAGLAEAGLGNAGRDQSEWTGRDGDVVDSRDFSASGYSSSMRLPRNVADDRREDDDAAAAVRPSASASRAVVRSATALRDWKGVHRDGNFARGCVDRFQKDVLALSKEYGLYPEVFMARIIAYSYDFVGYPQDDPADHNVVAMKRPDGEGRARFRSAREALRAYAVVNAGEITRLSADGALAKHDRKWTMRKIIESYAAVSALGRAAGSRDEYQGSLGSASLAPAEENDRLEWTGEATKMVSSVERKVKDEQARKAGYDNWEDYVVDLPDDVRRQEEEKAANATSAISKKKAFNLGRRVEAKKGNRE